MELRHLRYFVTLAECLSFTRAAERVHVTQSTLSHQIRQLEDEIGQPLFDRIGKRVVLTEAGESFLGYASKALREVDAGLSHLMRAGDELSGEVRIGATGTFNISFVPECLAVFLQRNPTVKVTVEELAADAIGQRLIDATLDVGIAYQPADPTHLWFEPLYTEEMVLVVSSTHPLAQRRRVRMVELHRQRLVLLPRDFTTRTMLEECFRASGAEPVVAAEMNAIAPMIGTVARTQLATIVSSHAVTPREDVRILPLESPTPMRTPGMLWKRDAKQPPAVRSFAACIRKLALGRSLAGWHPPEPGATARMKPRSRRAS
ncbi:LysR substrate-binding domain-containing protein [Ramlibacter tataouinensis]|uniref:LysR substrate-binding domain-containing protein n=1 Tax=Ramlibacter tataouinensis TaxID=94132 RepID=UPI0022F3C2E0|nr:LysR substrate-binding domain-containing protein [Ramlibacter tataouinensis]WBY03282.1 LysR substrate-binding domain-containing protein [Ramlibacter tataouinensis]